MRSIVICIHRDSRYLDEEADRLYEVEEDSIRLKVFNFTQGMGERTARVEIGNPFFIHLERYEN